MSVHVFILGVMICQECERCVFILGVMICQECERSCICVRGNDFARNVSVHVFVLGVMICQECDCSCICTRVELLKTVGFISFTDKKCESPIKTT